jgi:predicted RNA binding protein YcfA (HicA-like mRNA interferase family)
MALQIQNFAEHNEIKIADILKLIKDDAWFQVAQMRSHCQFKHPSKPGRVTIAGRPSDELAKGTQYLFRGRDGALRTRPR